MKDRSRLNRAWFNWRRTTRPTDNVRSGRKNAPTYGLEYSLDHVASYMDALGREIGSRDLGRSELVSRITVDLDLITLELENHGIPEAEKQKYRDYILATRSVINEIRKI